MNTFGNMVNILFEENRIFGLASVIGLTFVVILLAIGFLTRHVELYGVSKCLFGIAFLMPAIVIVTSLFLVNNGIFLPNSIWTPSKDLTALTFCFMFSLGFSIGGYGLESS